MEDFHINSLMDTITSVSPALFKVPPRDAYQKSPTQSSIEAWIEMMVKRRVGCKAARRIHLWRVGGSRTSLSYKAFDGELKFRTPKRIPKALGCHEMVLNFRSQLACSRLRLPAE